VSEWGSDGGVSGRLARLSNGRGGGRLVLFCSLTFPDRASTIWSCDNR